MKRLVYRPNRIRHVIPYYQDANVTAIGAQAVQEAAFRKLLGSEAYEQAKEEARLRARIREACKGIIKP